MKGLADYVHNLGLKIGFTPVPDRGPAVDVLAVTVTKTGCRKLVPTGDLITWNTTGAAYGNVIDGLPENDPLKVSSLSYNGGSELYTAMKPYKMMGEILRQQKWRYCV